MLSDKQKHLVNFKTLSAYTGGNAVFEKELITAFKSDLELFRTYVNEQPDASAFLQFKKSYHDISPSLKMLEITQLLEAIEDYKNAYSNDKETVPIMAGKIRRILDTVLLEADQWLAS